MRIKFPGIKQTDLDYAVGCLNNCMQSDASEFGFNYPYFTPGGAYGKQWWQLDSSLALSGYKWILLILRKILKKKTFLLKALCSLMIHS